MNVICRDPRKKIVVMQVSSDRLTRLIDIGKFEEEKKKLPPSLRVFNYISEYFFFRGRSKPEAGVWGGIFFFFLLQHEY